MRKLCHEFILIIIWTENGKRQAIVFIDLKGLERAKELDDEKIQLKYGIKELEQNPLQKMNI